jgi:hypothetical protein
MAPFVTAGLYSPAWSSSSLKSQVFPQILDGGNLKAIHLLAAFLLVQVASTLLLIVKLTQSYMRDLPPVPRGLPVIGNVLHGADQEWLALSQCKDDFGGTPYL